MNRTTEGITTAAGYRSEPLSTGRYSRFSVRTTQGSRSRRTVELDGSSNQASAGVTVSATAIDAAMATVNAMPRGRSRRPSIPLRKNSGQNTKRMMIVANTTAARTSNAAL